MKFFPVLPSLVFAAAVLFGLTGCDLKRDSGLWRGTVVVREADGRSPYTCQVELNITHTGETVTIHHLTTSCDSFASKWHGDTYEVHGNSLFYNGRDVGWARDDGAVILELDHADMRERFPILADKVTFSWLRVGDSLEFTEKVSFYSRTKHSSGWLKRVR